MCILLQRKVTDTRYFTHSAQSLSPPRVFWCCRVEHHLQSSAQSKVLVQQTCCREMLSEAEETQLSIHRAVCMFQEMHLFVRLQQRCNKS